MIAEQENNTASFLIRTGAYMKRNIILFLSVLSFSAAGFDFTAEASLQNNDSGYYTIVNVNSAKPSKPRSTYSFEKSYTPVRVPEPSPGFALISSELYESLHSRPPPIA